METNTAAMNTPRGGYDCFGGGGYMVAVLAVINVSFSCTEKVFGAQNISNAKIRVSPNHTQPYMYFWKGY